MKKIILTSFFLLGAIFIISSCKHEKDKIDDAPVIIAPNITSFTISKTLMEAFDTATVTMIATGDDLSYLWYSDKGTIVPTAAANIKKFTACSSCAGYRTIICKVSNSIGEVSDTVNITVNP